MRPSNSDRTLDMSWGMSSAGMACPCTGPATCTAARYRICLQIGNNTRHSQTRQPSKQLRTRAQGKAEEKQSLHDQFSMHQACCLGCWDATSVDSWDATHLNCAAPLIRSCLTMLGSLHEEGCGQWDGKGSCF